MRTKILSLFLVLAIPAIAAARYCNNPNCAMCNALFGPMPGYNSVVIPQAVQAPVPQIKSTPVAAVDVMLAHLDLKPTDVLYDLGCGDGRLLIRARQQYGCLGVGIEIDPAVARIARQRVLSAKCGGIRIVTGDALRYDLAGADAVVLYQNPPLLRRLLSRLRTRRIASYSHQLPGIPCREVSTAVGSVWIAEPETRKPFQFAMW